jgi:Zn-finger nucleic acid-binding protein
MNCKHCGAPINLGEEQNFFHCDYCGSYDFPDRNKDGVALLDKTSPYACPICKTPLVEAMIEEIRIFSCPNCRGNLINQSKMFYILRLAPRLEMILEDELNHPNRSELQRKITCPSCQKRMETYPYAGSGNVIIQGCKRCELIWLDFGELSRMIHAYVQMDKYSKIRDEYME